MPHEFINDPVTFLLAGGAVLGLAFLGILLWDSYYRSFKARSQDRKRVPRRG